MIQPAQNYEHELNRLYCKTFYDPKYMYYRGCWGTKELFIPDNTYDSHHFVILNNNYEVIGYVTYAINFASKVVNNFGIISFKQSVCFGIDLMKIIDDIFIKYNMNKIEFRAFADNPVIKHYYSFINKYNGRVVGTLIDSVMLEDGNLHDDTMFELFRENYLNVRIKEYEKRIKKTNI